jgi:hypothetical protein
MGNFLASIGMSLVPRAWWRGWEPESTVYFRWGVMVSGLLEFSCFFLIAASHVGGVFALLIVLVFSTLRLLLNPVGFVLLFFISEGALRFWAAFITDETLPSFPLWLAACLHGHWAAKKREEALGPRVADLVEPGTEKDYDLRISSCRPKDAWSARLLTVAYERQFYEVVREERGRPPRPFVYLLRKAPEDKVIRGLHKYHPDEPLQNE